MIVEGGYGAQLLVDPTGFEAALADVEWERISGTNAELIKDIWDPDRCPINLLGYLAWAMGVNYWDQDWSETTKRQWVKRQWDFKSQRGTRGAIEMILDYASRDVSPFPYRVRSVIAPPQRIYSGPSLTVAERESWMQQLPQVRTWRVGEKGTAPNRKVFSGGTVLLSSLRQHDPRFCTNRNFFMPSRALERLKRRAKWVVGGVETDTTVAELGNYFQLYIKAEAGRRVFSNTPIYPSQRFYLPSTAGQRVITIQPTTVSPPWRSVVPPSMQPVTSEPQRIVVSGVRNPHTVFSGVPINRGGGIGHNSHKKFFLPSTAWKRIYWRYAVNDGTVMGLHRPPVQFMGVGRFGFPKFTAWVNVEVRSKRQSRKAGEGFTGGLQKFWLPHDYRPTNRVKAAIRAAKLFSDKICVETGPAHRFLASEAPVLADINEVRIGTPFK